MIFKSVQLNEVNRARQVIPSAAGKALNTARALASLGIDARVSGFNGGATGDLINRFLGEYGVSSALTSMTAETRICSTLIDESTGTITELVEEAPQPSKPEIAEFIKVNIELVKSSQMLVICGTLPPWAPDDFYRNFTTVAAKLKVPVIIDSHKGALLSVLEDNPLVAKLNFRELETTFGERIESEAQLIDLMGRLVSRGAENVFLTQGKDTAYLLEGGALSKHLPPAIMRHLNPIGSGDCTTAGLVGALLQGNTFQESVRSGLACGSANVESLVPADIRRERVLELLR
jgi:1-phosphofructokinase family hexose kinase